MATKNPESINLIDICVNIIINRKIINDEKKLKSFAFEPAVLVSSIPSLSGIPSLSFIHSVRKSASWIIRGVDGVTSDRHLTG